MDYLRLINKENPIDIAEIDAMENSGDLYVVENNQGHDLDCGFEIKLEKQTLQAYKALAERMKKDFNITTFVRSGFRNVKAQELALEDVANTKFNGNKELAKKLVADVATSEHHTGLAADVNFVINETLADKVVRKLKTTVAKVQKNSQPVSKLEKTRADYYQKMASVCADYGFIVRYPEGKFENPEPWHLRYVGSAEIAKEIMQKGISFEEFCSQKEILSAEKQSVQDDYLVITVKDELSQQLAKETEKSCKESERSL